MEKIIVKETKIVNVEKYKALDGEIFTTEEACRKYENELLKKDEKRFEEMCLCSLRGPEVFNIYDARLEVLLIEKPEDIEILDRCVRNHGKWIDSYVKDTAETIIKHYPCKIIYFENDAFADIYDAQTVVNQCLDCVINITGVKQK